MQFRLLSAGLHISVFTLSILVTCPSAAGTDQESVHQLSSTQEKVGNFAAFSPASVVARQHADPAEREQDKRISQSHAGMLMLFLQAASGKKLGGG